jgi:iron complex outermembrane receptor protein
LTNNKELEFARDLTTTVIGVFQVPRTYGLHVGFRERRASGPKESGSWI